MKKEKELKRRYGQLAESMQAYYDHLDLRLLDELDDDGFAYIMKNVKGVNMLDLNETGISNASIKLLSDLEYVTELRAKSCNIDNGCISDLNKIPGLEFLHLKNTGVTIDGLLELRGLADLRTILFSESEPASIKDKMMQLKSMHPACEFIIDGKTWYFDNAERFLYAVKGTPVRYRLKIKEQAIAEEWSSWIIKPSDSYFETEHQGPHSSKEIEWIEVDPAELRREGSRLPAKTIDHAEQLMQLLEDLAVPYMPVDGIIRIYLTDQRTA